MPGQLHLAASLALPFLPSSFGSLAKFLVFLQNNLVKTHPGFIVKTYPGNAKWPFLYLSRFRDPDPF
jgi:hypothetical protein